MRTLISDDDQMCCDALVKLLNPYGETTIVHDGRDAIETFTKGLLDNNPYDLICLDVIMPGLDGLNCLKAIRAIECAFGLHGSAGVRILMTSAVEDKETIMAAFRGQCEGYLVKPINCCKLFEHIKNFGFTTTKD